MILDVLKDNVSVCVFDAEKDMSYDPLFASFALAAVRFVVVMVLDTDSQAANIMPPKLRCASLINAEFPMR